MSNEEQLLAKIIEKLDNLDTQQQEMKQNQNQIINEQLAMNQRLEKMEQDTEFAAHTIARLEIEHGKKLDMLMDNAHANIEKSKTTEAAIVSLTDKVEKLEIEFDVLKNAK